MFEAHTDQKLDKCLIMEVSPCVTPRSQAFRMKGKPQVALLER
jgi:hypothetical protein